MSEEMSFEEWLRRFNAEIEELSKRTGLSVAEMMEQAIEWFLWKFS